MQWTTSRFAQVISLIKKAQLKASSEIPTKSEPRFS